MGLLYVTFTGFSLIKYTEKNKKSSVLFASFRIYGNKTTQVTFELARRGVLETRHWHKFFKETRPEGKKTCNTKKFKKLGESNLILKVTLVCRVHHRMVDAQAFQLKETSKTEFIHAQLYKVS